jgi:hypothetical protein
LEQLATTPQLEHQSEGTITEFREKAETMGIIQIFWVAKLTVVESYQAGIDREGPPFLMTFAMNSVEMGTFQ